jgi:hypothetical protein
VRSWQRSASFCPHPSLWPSCIHLSHACVRHGGPARFWTERMLPRSWRRSPTARQALSRFEHTPDRQCGQHHHFEGRRDDTELLRHGSSGQPALTPATRRLRRRRHLVHRPGIERQLASNRWQPRAAVFHHSYQDPAVTGTPPNDDAPGHQVWTHDRITRAEAAKPTRSSGRWAAHLVGSSKLLTVRAN